ncbi:O-antigen ligase family protein [Synechococcus moorigangaii CMS01]|nr:O-antigen ligase family protein [Synechococcus moorigangaii CMS01]
MNSFSNLTTGRWFAYGGALILIVFMFLPPSYYLMAAFPWILIWQGGFLLLGIALLVMLRKFEQPFRPLGYGLDWGILAVAIACGLSTIFAPFKGVALFNLVTVSGYGVALYGLRNLGGPPVFTWQNQWRGLVGLGFGISLASLVGWLLVEHRLERNSIPFGHHNFVAAYLCLILPIILSFALAQRRKVRVALLGLSTIIPYLLYTCSSRGGFVGLLLWAIATIAFVIGRTKGKKRLISGTIALFLLGIMVTAGLQHPRVQRLIQVNFNDGLPTVQFQVDGETEDRLFMWQAGLNILRDRPLTGIGLGNMSREYNLYRPINVGSGAAHIQQLHSNPIQLLGELGLIGGAAIAFFSVQLVRLGYRIHKNTDNPQIKRLLYGLGGGWFAYAMATLTDYQLENIPISFTLTLTLVLLLTVADQVLEKTQPQSLPTSPRRLWSLGSFAGFLGALLITAPYSAGMYFFSRGQSLWAKGEPEAAFTTVNQAYALNGWNVNYPLRLGLWLLETRNLGAENGADPRRTTELATEYFLEAQALIPNDYYANVNVGVLLLELDPSLAQVYFERAIQLLAREAEPTYFLLGQTYLQTDQREKVIAAFALQGLVDPNTLTLGQWDQAPLATVRIEAVEAALALYQDLLDRLEPQDPYVTTLQERMAWLAWWHGLPIPHRDHLSQFSPIVQALILGDRQPEQALAIIDQQIAQNPDDSTRWLILKSWFQPEFNLNLNLKQAGEAEPQNYLLVSRRDEGITLQEWLRQIPQEIKPLGSERLASRLLYRSEDFEAVDTVLRPEGLQGFQLLALLELGSGYPRTFPALDQLINEVRTEALGLPHPTENNFQLSEQ